MFHGLNDLFGSAICDKDKLAKQLQIVLKRILKP